jgi:transposase-like protein
MNKAEQNRLVNWRHKFLQHARHSGNVAETCRYFGISRTKFYKWKKRFEKHGVAGLSDQSRAPRNSPNETPKAVVSKILYLRQNAR